MHSIGQNMISLQRPSVRQASVVGRNILDMQTPCSLKLDLVYTQSVR